tara:strand:- start:1169 stop:1816 length:648 start_codon:yes stop_codon:yes gene_type:complete
MPNNKLQNIKAVQQMIDGTHKFQTKKAIGFSDAEAMAKKAQRHEVGDTWEETDARGNVYIIEQKEGFRIRKTKNSDLFQEVRDELRAFPKCQKSTCTCYQANQLDEKMRKIHGMCFDCVIEMEHQMKKDGTFDAYAHNKIRENALAWLRDAEQDVVMLKQTYTEASKFVLNGAGETESYAARMTPQEFEEKIEKSFVEFKENFLKKLNGENNENN